MARGLSREQSQQKNVKATAAANKGNQEGLSATARAERDAKVMQEKAAKKAAEKEAKIAAGNADQVKAEEAAKAAKKAAKKDAAAMNTQAAKAALNSGALDVGNRELKVKVVGEAGSSSSSSRPVSAAPKTKLTAEEKRKKAAEAAMKAAMEGAPPPKKEKKKKKDKAEDDEDDKWSELATEVAKVHVEAGETAATEPSAKAEPAAEDGPTEENEAAIAAEAVALEEQRACGGPVFRRLRGEPGLCASFAPTERQLCFREFCTYGAPELVVSEGTAYYEVVIGEALENPQVGFATTEFETGVDMYDGDGVGDCANSWGIDGTRHMRWHEGEEEYDFEWAAGDVIGLAADLARGQMAVSKNGSWSAAGCGALFTDGALKSGVYPVVSGEGGSIKVRLDGEFDFGPPCASVWATE
uniref:B30.2/SPRY domain-containing protein n=1 Tax=Calcidiscus leptoporus TaxID=127549 RepID=A0A7S0NTJ2_9EUKA|mmetsp:Transcript_2343/g.5302  ORF Transcript_2343/g.5302 Transcript_2343/m.5302 type:complete len:413 (+) Transcript_2343:76-1314(+)